MRHVAYVIKDTVLSEPFEVYFSNNAWWMDRGKVHALFLAFKRGFTVKEACDYGGISLDQYKYFCKVHPEFYTAKHRCESLLSILAKELLVKDLETNPETRRWYLERIQPERYGRPNTRRRPNFES